MGYDVLRERNPGLVFCSITGYGQTGPYTARSGHDMNYLGLIGMLDLTGAADGAPVQSAGQIADLGGGGLMAAYSILAALREAERTRPGPGRGRVDGRRRPVVADHGGGPVPGRRPAARPRVGEPDRRDRLLPARTRARTGTSRSARWSRSSGPRGAPGSGART